MRKSSKLLAALLVAAMSLSTVAFAESDPEYVFKVVTEQSPENPESEAHMIVTALEAYIADGHPNFSYEIEVVAQNDLASRLAILVASNDVPDIFNYEDGTALDALIELDAVVNISQDFNKLGIELTDVIPESVIDSKHTLSNYEDIYSMPSQVTTNGMYYNKAIFAELGLEVPTTWQELEAACDVILEAGYIPIASNGADGWGITRWIMMYADRLAGNDVHLKAAMNVDGVSFRDEVFLEAAAKCQEMYQKGYMGEAYNSQTTTEQYALFCSGEAAMIYTGGWFASTLIDESSNPIPQEDIGYFTPGGIEGSELGVEYGLGLDDLSCANAICLGKAKFDEGTNHDFLRFLFENIGTYQRESGVISPYYSDLETEDEPVVEMLRNHLETESLYPTLWFEAKMDAATQDVAQYNAQLLAEGTMTPEEYCEALAASVDENYPVE